MTSTLKEAILRNFPFGNYYASELANLQGTGDWRTGACPFHEDRDPSFAVNVNNGGWKCHAGCGSGDLFSFWARRKGMDLRRDFRAILDQCAAYAGVAPLDLPATLPASEVPQVADWLRRARALPDSEIARMRAAHTPKGPVLAFEYTDAEGAPTYVKFRPVSGKKTFWRTPKNAVSVLYGLPILMTSRAQAAVVVEGELDAHALRACGIDPVVSVPDGTGSKLTPELLAPLSRFDEILVAVDADTAGDKFAERLAEALGKTRCRRVRWTEGAGQ